MDKKLKMINCNHPEISNILKALGIKHRSDKTDNNSWWYLHRELEDVCGYDKAIIYNMDEFPEYVKETFNWSTIRNGISHEPLGFHKEMYFNGIMPVEVYGINKPCIGYFWVTQEESCINTYNNVETPYNIWNQQGLVCFESDLEGRNYALKKYLNKSGCI